MSYELGALESPLSRTDTASALLAHTETGRGYEGLTQKPNKAPISTVQRDICPISQLHLTPEGWNFTATAWTVDPEQC